MNILKINNGVRQNSIDIVTEEIPLTIYINNKEFVTLLCSPNNLKELSAGFLYSTGLIKSIDDIKIITIDDEKWISYVELKNELIDSEIFFKRLYTTGCGKGIIFYNVVDLMHRKPIESNLRISSEKITTLMNFFQKMSVMYKETGGVHSAGLSDENRIIIFDEDIGRHNAIDKVIGQALMKNLNMFDKLVFTSGRITSEIIFKVQKMRAGFVISRSAPTDQAIKLAKEMNISLIGFARGSRMNIYSAIERIL